MDNIQLAAINPIDRANGRFEVVVHSEDDNLGAMFDCDSEHDALRLRNAIRDFAVRLRRTFDYRG